MPVTHLDHTFSTQGSFVNLSGTPTYAQDGGSAVQLDEGESIYYTLPKATIDAQTPDKAFAIYVKLKCSGDSQFRLLLTRPDATWIIAHPAQAPASQAGWPYTRLDQTSWGSGYAGFSFVDRNEDDSKYDDDVRVTLGNITPTGQTALTGTIYIERIIIRGYTNVSNTDIHDDMVQFADGWPAASSTTAALSKGSLLGTLSSDFMGCNAGLYKTESWGMFDDFGNDRGLHGEYFTNLYNTFPWGHWRGPGGGSPSLLQHDALGGWDTEDLAKSENLDQSYWMTTSYGPGNPNTLIYHDTIHIFSNVSTVLTDINIIDGDKYGPRPFKYFRYPGEHRDNIASLYAAGATTVIVELGNEVYGGGSAGTSLMGYNPGSLGRTELTDSGNADAVKHVDSYLRRAINIARDLKGHWPDLKFAVPINIDTTADDTHVWDIRVKQALNGTHPLNFDLTPWVDYIVWHNYGQRQHLSSSRVEDEWYQADIVARTNAKIDDIYSDYGLPVIISECGPVTHSNVHMKTYGYHLRSAEVCMALEADAYIRKHCDGKLPYVSWHGVINDTMGIDIPNAAPYDPDTIKYHRSSRFYSGLLRTLTHGDDCYDCTFSGAAASDLTGLWFEDGVSDRVMVINTGANDITLSLPFAIQAQALQGLGVPARASRSTQLGYFTPTDRPDYDATPGGSTIVVRAQSWVSINPRTLDHGDEGGTGQETTQEGEWQPVSTQTMTVAGLVDTVGAADMEEIPSMVVGGTVVAAPGTEGDVLQTLTLRNNDAVARTSVPITFGAVFKEGDVPFNDTVVGKLDGSESVDLQIEWKKRWGDGSYKHGIVSFILDDIGASATRTLDLVYLDAPQDNGTAITIGPTLAADRAVVLTANGGTAALQTGVTAGANRTWQSGDICTEEHYNVALGSDTRLKARFHLREYSTGAMRVDVICENCNISADGADDVTDNITYADLSIDTNTNLYSKGSFEHHYFARWRKTFWFGSTHDISVIHTLSYLVSTKLVPNYNTSDPVSTWDNRIAGVFSTYSDSNDIMETGAALPYMPNTGGRGDYGPNPTWVVLYLLTGDKDAEAAMYGTADSSQSWPVCMRDNRTSGTGEPVSVKNVTNFTRNGNLTGTSGHPFNGIGIPSQPLDESKGNQNVVPDNAHQPAFNFVPYMLSGDYYYLENHLFYVSWMPTNTAPGNHGNGQGWLDWDQPRACGWGLRGYGQAWALCPETDELGTDIWDDLVKHYITNGVARMNIYVNVRPSGGDPFVRLEGVRFFERVAQAVNNNQFFPFPNHFLIYSLHQIHEWGFTAVEPIRDWMLEGTHRSQTDSTYCRQFSTFYTIKIPDGTEETCTYATCWTGTINDKYSSSDATAIFAATCGTQEMVDAVTPTSGGNQINEIGDYVGYPGDPQGYPASFQMVLGALKDVDPYGDGTTLYEQFRTRPTQPGWSTRGGPTFYIEPRT